MPHAEASIGETNYLGGKDVGPAPYELLCSALGACTAITLRMYAGRKQWSLRSVHVSVHFRRLDNEEQIHRVMESWMINSERGWPRSPSAHP